MAKTKLKQLEVDEVSLVDAGANQGAHVKLYKNRDGKPGEGFVPGQEEKTRSGLRKLFSAIGKALNIPDDDIESAADSIEKADTFSQKMEERKLRRITDEIWDVCYALESSLGSIMWDEEVVDKTAMMNQSIDEFTATIKGLTAAWGAGKSAQIAKADISVDHMQESAERLESMIAKAKGKCEKEEDDPDDPADPEDPEEEDDSGNPQPAGGSTGKKNGTTETKKSKEGGYTDMKFNETNMTAADRLAFEELKKRYGMDDSADNGTKPSTEGVEKGAGTQGAEGSQGQGTDGDDIYKGLNPMVAAELKSLRKRADEAHEKELMDVAKKYEILGKKPEELVQTFKSLEAAGGTAYADMLGTLDAAVAMVENSGTFAEIGKRGNGSGNNSADAWSKIEKHAEEIRKASPELNYAESIDRACVQHPELVAEYENNR